MEKRCIHCGAPIHEEASFCHTCGQSQIVKQVPKLPNRWHRKGMLFCLVLLILLLPAVGTLFRSQEETVPHIPVKVTWYDINNAPGYRPDELNIRVSGTGYDNSLILSEEGDWTGEIPYNSDFTNKKLLDELDFDVTDGNGMSIAYREEINYRNETLHINLRYRVPFIVQWDDNNNAAGKRPESIYVSMCGSGDNGGNFSCEFSYTTGKISVPLQAEYIHSTANITVYTDDTKREILDAYTPSLSYDPTDCSVTLIMTPKQEDEMIPVPISWFDKDDTPGKRPDEVVLTITTTDNSYHHTAAIKESDGWQLTIPNHNKFTNESYLKNEVEFTVEGINGEEIPYVVDVDYQDGMSLEIRYHMPFEVKWDSDDHPDEIYVVLQGTHFRSGFSYKYPRAVIYYDDYDKDDVSVQVFTDEDRKEPVDYKPTLSYNKETCSATLIMNSVK